MPALESLTNLPACALLKKILPLRGAGGWEDVFVGAGAPKKAAGTYDKYDNAQLAEAIPEMQVS